MLVNQVDQAGLVTGEGFACNRSCYSICSLCGNGQDGPAVQLAGQLVA
jgi:hypothetical protein